MMSGLTFDVLVIVAYAIFTLISFLIFSFSKNEKLANVSCVCTIVGIAGFLVSMGILFLAGVLAIEL